MSNYINSAKHFNSIQAELVQIVLKNSHKMRLPNESEHNTLEEQVAQVEQYISIFKRIQVVCVTLQYKHHYEGELNEQIALENMDIERKTEVKKLTLHGLYNAVKNSLYQLEIDHLTKTRALTESEEDAVKFFEDLPNYIAAGIVAHLPEDKTCTWSID